MGVRPLGPPGVPLAPAQDMGRSSCPMPSHGASLHPSQGARRSTHPSGHPKPQDQVRVSLECPGGERGSAGCPSPRSAREMPPSPPGLGHAGGLLQHPSTSPRPLHPPRAPSTSFPLPGSRKPEPPEQLPGVDPASTPPPTLTGSLGPPKPLGDVQGAAPLFALSHPLQQVRSGLGALWPGRGGGGHGGGEAPKPMHPWRLRTPGCVLGAALPREPEQRVKR